MSALDRTTGRLLRGYGPLIGVALIIAVVAVFMPTVNQKIVTRTVASGDTAGDAAGGADPGSAGSPGAAGSADAGGAAAVAARARGAVPPGTGGPCKDRAQQVPGDPYSPPCIAFSGNNGGATSKGVTADTIVVSSRLVADLSSIAGELNEVTGGKISETADDVKRETLALVDYFNNHFQFYGRKIKLEFFEGKGSGLSEILGGGQEEAEADAVKVSAELKAFAEASAVTTVPYGDALARRGVLSFGVPSPSAEWMTARRPYVWSMFSDCSTIIDNLGDWVHKRLANRPARYAGGSLQGKPRTMVSVSPDNPWYQDCLDRGDRLDKANGVDVERMTYKLDLSSSSNQAADVVAKLKDQKVTTVLCGCDPFFLIFATAKAKEQGYHPEWIVTAAGLSDLDVAGQLFDKDEWSHAFGISFLGAAQPPRATLGYHAYKSVRSDEPAFSVDLIYAQLYLLALGIQMAGPNLTPETFERGMFAYPGGSGPMGTWTFGPGHYTPQRDGKEIWWDPNRRSVVNGESGTYVETEPGKRYRAGQWPPGDPPVFR